jgi:hypothetical protein
MTVAAGSIVKETSTTTGTGSYTLAGAVTNFRAFNAAVSPSSTAIVPYVARMGALYEAGIGLLSASTTLQRVGVYESTNANAAVNWAAGTKEIYMGTPASGVFGKHNLAAAVAPTSGDNYVDGYAEGSMWVVRDADDDYVYLCTYAGVPGSTAARWLLVGSYSIESMGFMSGSGVAAASVALGPITEYCRDSNISGVVGLGFDGVADWSGIVLQGHGQSGSGSEGMHQTMRAGLVKETTNATPAPLENAYDGLTYLFVPLSSCLLIKAFVIARDHTGNDLKAWELSFAVKRNTSGDPALVGSLTKTAHAADAGAATWDVGVSIDTTNDGFQIDVTGEAATTIRWTATVQATQVAFT